MNWDMIEGKWEEFRGQVRSKWAKLTDDDVANLKGKRDRLAGALQTRYGILKDDADRQIDEWVSKIEARANKSDPNRPKHSSP